MKFSLIMATVDRTAQVSDFLKSLKEQTYKDFELIVVDQNEDNRLKSLIGQYEIDFSIIRLKCGRGLSKARNVGLRKVSGDIVAFPDDDCLYPSDLMQNVKDWLISNPEYAGVSGQTVDSFGKLAVSSYDNCSGNVSKFNIWKRINSTGLFVRKKALDEKIFFDERLGIGAGTFWGSAEDIDFSLLILLKGFKLYYESSLKVIHPQKVIVYNKNACIRGLSYAAGMGFVIKKHNYPLWFKAKMLIRPLGGISLSILSLRFFKALFHWNVFRGRIRGLTS